MTAYDLSKTYRATLRTVCVEGFRNELIINYYLFKGELETYKDFTKTSKAGITKARAKNNKKEEKEAEQEKKKREAAKKAEDDSFNTLKNAILQRGSARSAMLSMYHSYVLGIERDKSKRKRQEMRTRVRGKRSL